MLKQIDILYGHIQITLDKNTVISEISNHTITVNTEHIVMIIYPQIEVEVPKFQQCLYIYCLAIYLMNDTIIYFIPKTEISGYNFRKVGLKYILDEKEGSEITIEDLDNIEKGFSYFMKAINDIYHKINKPE